MSTCKLPPTAPSQIQHLQNTTTIGYTATDTSPDPLTGTPRCQVCQYLLSQDEAPAVTCSKKWIVSCESIDIKSAAPAAPATSPSSLTVSNPSPTVVISSALSATTSSTKISSLFPASPSTSSSSFPDFVSQGETASEGQSFLNRTVEIAGVRIPTIALIGGGAGLLVIILMAFLLVLCRRRRHRVEQRNLSKGKGILDPEKCGYSRHDDDDNDNDEGHSYSYIYVHESSSGYKTEPKPKPKTELYPSQQMIKSATSSFTPRHHRDRSGSRSPDRPHSASELLPIASKHLSQDGFQAGNRHNSVPMLSSSMVLSSSSSSLVPPPPSSTDHQIPPIRQDALLSSISLSPIPYVPKSMFTPRSHQHSDPTILMVSSPRQSESDFVELIPVEETPRLAHTALAIPRVHEAQTAMVAEVIMPVVEEVSETILEREQDGGSQETLVAAPPLVVKADAQIQTDSSTCEPWLSKGAMTKRQLKKQRRRANRQAARERRESAALKSFLARSGSVSKSLSKVDQGSDDNDNDNDSDAMSKKVRPVLIELAELSETSHGFRARNSIRRAKRFKSHARREVEGRCLGCQRGLCRVPPWQWEDKQRARVLHEGDGACTVYGSYETVGDHFVKTLTTGLSKLENPSEGEVVV